MDKNEATLRLAEAEMWWQAMTTFQNPAELEIWAQQRLADLRKDG